MPEGKRFPREPWGGCRARGVWPQLCWVSTTRHAPPGGAIHVECHVFSAPDLPETLALSPPSLASPPVPLLSPLWDFDLTTILSWPQPMDCFSPTLFPKDGAKMLSAVQEEL